MIVRGGPHLPDQNRIMTLGESVPVVVVVVFKPVVLREVANAANGQPEGAGKRVFIAALSSSLRMFMQPTIRIVTTL